MIDWTTCPRCDQPLKVRRFIRVIEYTDMDLMLSGDGTLRSVAWGESEYYDDGDSQSALVCAHCDSDLPDEYCDAIYEALS